MTYPLPVALEASPNDYHWYVGDLLNSAFDIVACTEDDEGSRERILADYQRFAGENRRKAEFFLAKFSALTAQRLTAVLPLIVRDIELGVMKLPEDATIVLVSRAVLEQGVRAWVLQGQSIEARGEQ